MQGQGHKQQNNESEERRLYLDGGDAAAGPRGNSSDPLAGADWSANSDGFGGNRRKDSDPDTSRGTGGGGRGIGVHRRSRSRSRSFDRHGARGAGGPEDDEKTIEDDRRFLYVCCKKCKTSNKTGKTCVCVVPRTQRRVQLHIEGGCRTCGCKGCTKEDREFNERNNRNASSNANFSQKNYNQNQNNRPTQGKRDSSSSQERDNKRGQYGQAGYSAEKGPTRGGSNTGMRRGGQNIRNRSRDSDSQESDSRSQHSNHNERHAFQQHETFGLGALIQNQYHKYPPLLGFGIPLRTQNYIMGETKPAGSSNPQN